LTIAHVMGFIRLFPSLKSLAEIGRLSLVWSMFMLIRKLILRAELPSFVVWMLAGGLVFIILFSEQNGKFFKGVAASLKNFIVIAINSIGFFSDVVSYVRLFAVGLASFAIAKSFNEMALSLGSGILAVVGTVLILLFAHSLNIVLSMMSLIVHGVRLNLLEFSGHLNIEWSGFEFKPFKKKH
jgi:V/A-type H+/Na+-transporting ATPase subunit I